MRGFFSRASWRLWRRSRARRVRLHRAGGLTFEGVVWYRDRYDLHLLNAGVYDADQKLEPVGGQRGHAWVPLGAVVFLEDA